MTMITIFLVLIFLLLVVLMVGLFLAWQKVSVFLTWNTRYENSEYETAITERKSIKPPAVASITTKKGRSIVPTDDLVDLADLDFETGIKAIEEAAQ